jgi:hypothetical protein
MANTVSAKPLTIVDEMMARFDYAYRVALTHFERMERIQQAYDNKINLVNWPTISEIAIPLTFVGVEEQLPFAMEYLFPDNRFINLIPVGNMVMSDRVEMVEDDLRFTLKNQMKIQLAAFPTVKDCYKFGVGYGLVDVQEVTPPEIATSQIISEGKLRASARRIVLGRSVLAPVFKYLSPIQVIPMPDGANIEGPNKASGHFVIDFKYEDEFRAMYKPVPTLEGDRPVLKGNPEDIIKEARSLNFDARMAKSDIIFSISGLNLTKTNNGDKKMPVVIPIVRCYFDNHHVWIANGTTEIWQSKNELQSMKSDCVKFSAWPDGLRWFPMNITEASEKTNLGANVWYNGLVDLAMYHMNPTRIIDEGSLGQDKSLRRGPKADIRVRGDVTKAVKYMDLPEFPGVLMTMGENLLQFHGKAMGNPSFMDRGNPGLVRGGLNTLEHLLSSSHGRQLLAAIILKTGGLEPTVEKVLLKKQLLIDERGESFIDVGYDENTGKRVFSEKTVTRDDFINVFRVELDLPAARMNSAQAFTERTALFDRTERDKEMFDTRKRYEMLVENPKVVRDIMLPKAVTDRRQEQMAQARMAAAARGEQPQVAPGSTPGEQAMMGAGAAAAAG